MSVTSKGSGTISKLSKTMVWHHHCYEPCLGARGFMMLTMMMKMMRAMTTTTAKVIMKKMLSASSYVQWGLLMIVQIVLLLLPAQPNRKTKLIINTFARLTLWPKNPKQK